MTGIGVAIYTFEGVGNILPIKETVAKNEEYTKVMIAGCSIYGLIVILFGLCSLFGYSSEDLKLPLVTEAMPRKSYMTWFIKLLYCVCTILTFPLLIFPVTRIIDSYTTASWRTSSIKTFTENLTRTILATFCCAVALSVYNNIPTMNGFAGALACCPLAFTMPALLHYKHGLAKTKSQRTLDIMMIVFSIGITIFTTEEVIRNLI